MPNWAYNNTVFVGPKATIDDIAHAITDGEFDFNHFNPTPAVLDAMASPARVISDAEFAEKYSLDVVPSTIDELTTFIETHDNTHILLDLPQTMHDVLMATYGANDWYTWRSRNWDTKWTGNSANAQRYHDNLLIVRYDTAWAPPAGVFSTLRNNYENLHIINGVTVEGFAEDGLDTSEGGITSFLTYFTSTSFVEVDVWDPSDLPDIANAPHNNALNASLMLTEEHSVNTDNIDMLIENGLLIGEDNTVISIADLDKA